MARFVGCAARACRATGHRQAPIPASV
jgi:hypothetical protein